MCNIGNFNIFRDIAVNVQTYLFNITCCFPCRLFIIRKKLNELKKKLLGLVFIFCRTLQLLAFLMNFRKYIKSISVSENNRVIEIVYIKKCFC